MDKIYVTKEGYESLKAELRYLIDVERPQVLQEIKEARAQGDLSENADYDAARDKQAIIEAKITELTEKIENAQIIATTGNSNVVKIGCYVVLKFSNGLPEAEYHIVGSTEVNPKENKISNECALAKAIMGAKTGDVVTVKAAKPYEVEITYCGMKSSKK
ncbi:MAG: transcription elongation factor GreA [Erysipelotrichaceae bacterium]|nr:transcription elongation factor GreA [Erysipelotrichaceae bacterium]